MFSINKLTQFRPFRGMFPLVAAVAFAALPVKAQVLDTFYNDTLYTSGNNINATNFFNDYGGTFSVPYVVGNGWISDLYQQWRYTRNFTNYSQMDCFTGFRFDRQISGHTMADSFYNAGAINCGVGSGSFFIVNPQGVTATVGGYGGIYVWATNIFNSGAITVGANGLGIFSGKNIEFNHGDLTMEVGFNTGLGVTNTAIIPAIGEVNKTTNEWNPAAYFSQTSAQISPAPSFLSFSLFNSTPYFDVASPNPTNRIVRMVFIQNDTPTVPYNVYFRNQTNALAIGGANIEWVGSYTDPTSGTVLNNYLYLTDDYVVGSSTNLLAKYVSGMPANYSLNQQTTPLGLSNPEVSSWPSLFGPNQPFPSDSTANTNIYSYMDASLVAATVGTNQVYGGAYTNLPGRFEISATNELNLVLSSITGMNYLLLKSTNNFDTDYQSLISAPYSDIYIGRTNCSFVVSNLLQSSLPFYSGEIKAWSSRWFYSDTNSGINYEFRMLMVESSLSPNSQSQQQDFVLNSSNNVVIADSLHISRNLSLNCTNLVLTTNGVGNGAGSPEGDLYLTSPTLSWQAAVPRLRVLTNSGVISLNNSTINIFGTPATPYYSFINNGTIFNLAGTTINANSFELNGGLLYAGLGSYYARSITQTWTNGYIYANGTITNITGSLIISNATVYAGKGLTLVATNLLTDGSVPGSLWTLGENNTGSGIAFGLNLATKPTQGDLLGTTIDCVATANSLVYQVWSGQDRGYDNSGFKDNAAIGQLILDGRGTDPRTQFYFCGSAGGGVTNAIYVDNLILVNTATNEDTSHNLKLLTFSNNIVIYYAQAMINGVTVAEKLNHRNNDRLRWVPTYTGIYSSTNLVYPPGVTNTFNAALTDSSDIDSDHDGIVNVQDATPFLTSYQMDFNIAITNVPPKSARLSWTTIPSATNFVYYKTNLLQPWLPFTNFTSYFHGGIAGGKSGSNSFATPFFTPTNPPANDFRTNVWVHDVLNGVPHFYRVLVQP